MKRIHYLLFSVITSNSKSFISFELFGGIGGIEEKQQRQT